MAVEDLLHELPQFSRDWESSKKETSKPLYIFDTGSPNSSLKINYPNITFLGLKSKPIAEEYKELLKICIADEFSTFQSGWHVWVKKMLATATDLVKHMRQGNLVMLQGAGPDYMYTDSIIACLVEVMIDPFYRTTEGFCTLLRKDFFVEGVVSSPFGITGQTQDVLRAASRGSFRQGYYLLSKTKKEDSYRDHWPFLFLFIHCVQELLLRYPCLFKFTGEFLVLVLDCFSASAASPLRSAETRDSSFRESWLLGLQLEKSKKGTKRDWDIAFQQYKCEIEKALILIHSTLHAPNSKLTYRNIYTEQRDVLPVDDGIEWPVRGFMNYMIHNHPVMFNHDDLLLEKIKAYGYGLRLSILQSNLMWISPGMLSHLQPFTTLTMSQGSLISLPAQFSSLSTLTELNFSQNNFISFPACLNALVHLKKLNLSSNNISNIPDFISGLTCLEELILEKNKISTMGGVTKLGLTMLNFSNNLLSVIPESFTKLGKISAINLSGNSINSIPESFLNSLSSDLTKINLSGNSIPYLPDRWNNFRNLETLNLVKNHLSDLPSSLAYCSGLKILHISSNKFQSWPAVIAKLSLLTFLDASENMFDELPYWLGRMKSITSLNVRGNKLQTVSHTISQMICLKNLDLSNNNIAELPSTLALLEPTLKKLDLQGNPLRIDRLDITADTPVSDVINYLKSNLSIVAPLLMTKMMVLGGPQSGKSTVIKKLVQGGSWSLTTPPTPFSETVPSSLYAYNCTIGGAVQKKSIFRTHSSVNIRKILVRVWDFNNNASIEGMYRNFVTQNTIILLTVNLMDPNLVSTLVYWYQSIRSFILEPKITLVLTFVDEWSALAMKKSLTKQVIELRKIISEINPQQNMEHIKICVPVELDAKDTDYIEAPLDMSLENTLATSLFINSSIPLKFLQLRDLLSKIGNSYLSKNQAPIIKQKDLILFGNACGIVDFDGVMDCARILHECGAIVYLRKTPELMDCIVLDPGWLAGLFETVLSFIHRPKNGILKYNKLQKFISCLPPAAKPQALALLETFEFGVSSIDGEETQLFLPDLLSSETPVLGKTDSAWHAQRILRFDFLPTRIFFRFLQLVVKVIHPLKSETSSGVFARPTINIWDSGLHANVGGIDVRISSALVNECHTMTIVQLHLNSLAEGVGTEQIDYKQQHVLSILIEAADEDKVVARRFFLEILKELSILLSAWPAVTSRAFFTLRQDNKTFTLALDELNTSLERGNFDLSIGTKRINLLDIAPDLYVGSYTGRRFGLQDFLLTDVLGEGSFATVRMGIYRGTGEELPTSENVAVKLLKMEKVSDVGANVALREFIQEIEIQGHLKHPNIVEVLGIILRPLCIVTELCLHNSLYQHINNWKTPISWDLRLRIVRDLASGIQFLQEQQPPIAHIDLKSPNVLLSSLNPKETCAKIADFGTSQAVTGPMTDIKVDNPRWQAPEMISRLPYNEKVDTYAFGVTCWELLVRKPFFFELSFSSDIAEYVASGERPQIPEDLCPPEYKQIIEGCWHQYPEKRPSMEHVLELITTLSANITPNYREKCSQYDAELRKQFKIQEREKRQREERQRASTIETTEEEGDVSEFLTHQHPEKLFQDDGRINVGTLDIERDMFNTLAPVVPLSHTSSVPTVTPSKITALNLTDPPLPEKKNSRMFRPSILPKVKTARATTTLRHGEVGKIEEGSKSARTSSKYNLLSPKSDDAPKKRESGKLSEEATKHKNGLDEDSVGIRK
eukprot:TRINITY_DN7619_c0_g1_i2.p1 TRINITY_DN7619_c0_g1~~TRINITY_DN7619_c0_g1_i2.p1  ORF type:complete len:2022 (-),score=440.49 TRINITY_DN7619_c0_g1_i2:87-5282(-)